MAKRTTSPKQDGEAATPRERAADHKGSHAQVREWVKSLAVALVLFLVLRTFVLQTFVIISGSMKDTLLVGDMLVANRLAVGARIPGTQRHLPGYSTPRRGDVVIFTPHHEVDAMLIKRLMGLPGDTLEMRAGVLIVNGEALDEPYVRPSRIPDDPSPEFGWQRDYVAPDVDRAAYRPTRDTWGPLVVPADHYFMLGDNRQDSYDSRYWGLLATWRVEARASFLYFSYNRDSYRAFPALREIRWGRLGQTLSAAQATDQGPDRAVTAGEIHIRVLATHDLHGALYPTTYSWSDGRPVGGVAALDAVMDTLQRACACPTLRLDGGDEMQGTLASNLTHGASMVAALNHLGIDAAAVGNHELDWGIDTLLARQREARYAWLAANVFRVTDGERPEWAKPYTIVERDGVRIGVVGYATTGTPRTLRPDVTAPYEFRPGYAGVRDAIEEVRRESPDFVVIVAHAPGECRIRQCGGETVNLANELPPGSVDLIVGGHDHVPGEGVANSIPIVRAGANAQAVAVVDLYRNADGTRSFDTRRQVVYADDIEVDRSMEDLLAPYLRTADALGREPVTTLSEPLDASSTGDRRLGWLIAESSRRAARADFGMHNPGAVRIDLPRGVITYADLHRVMPFDNTIVTLTLSGALLRQLVEQTGPRYYYANLSIAYRQEAGGPRFGRATLTFADGAPVLDAETYTLATNDFLADGGDALAILATLPSVHVGVTTLDAVATYLRAMPAPVTLPPIPR